MRIKNHALRSWKERAVLLGLNSSRLALEETLARAKPEIPTNRSTQWNLFIRMMRRGETDYMIADGWRFVVVGEDLVTVERVRPHENFGFPARITNL
jgi:hypothetical protein